MGDPFIYFTGEYTVHRYIDTSQCATIQCSVLASFTRQLWQSALCILSRHFLSTLMDFLLPPGMLHLCQTLNGHHCSVLSCYLALVSCSITLRNMLPYGLVLIMPLSSRLFHHGSFICRFHHASFIMPLSSRLFHHASFIHLFYLTAVLPFSLGVYFSCFRYNSSKLKTSFSFAVRTHTYLLKCAANNDQCFCIHNGH